MHRGPECFPPFIFATCIEGSYPKASSFCWATDLIKNEKQIGSQKTKKRAPKIAARVYAVGH